MTLWDDSFTVLCLASPLSLNRMALLGAYGYFGRALELLGCVSSLYLQKPLDVSIIETVL